MKHCIAILILALTFTQLSAAESPGQTRIAKWHDDKSAAILLMFDDSMPSQVKNVVPELKKRGFIATFYVNPGKGEWNAFRTAWEKEIPAAGMEYGNHTHTHSGIVSLENGEEEISKCNDAIQKVFPDRKAPRLISFGVPGVAAGKWLITPAQLKELLDKHNLVERPKNVGSRFATISLKSSAEMLAVVDKAIAAGNMDCICFHGVGGEWLSATVATFMELMDGLTERKEKLWIADHISAHKYETERKSAEVKVLSVDEKKIALTLTSKADPKLFDQPLTLVTSVPASWKKAKLSNGTEVAAINGSVKFSAVPSDATITLEPAN